jgi:DNA (cytosine-5)-methyltransferase 1
MKPIRGADLFCGSGGLSTGLVRACEQLFPGRPLDLVAVNHWQTAINTHQLNHPGVRHFCADLEHLKPRDAVPGGVLDILLAAPSCTYHSRARGGRPVYDQQRMDPWHVVRWCTDLRVHCLIVENVPEFVDWGPCDAHTGKPLKTRKGEYFRAWIAALKAIGMRGEWKFLTCADYGDATTRERFFFYGRSDRKAHRWPEPSHAARGKETDLLGSRATWRSAAEIIDWSRPGSSIFTRKRPLVKNTIARLLAGAKRNHWPQQHVDALQALLDGTAPRLQVSAEEAEWIAAQLGVPLVMATGGGGTARGVDRPIPTLTAGGEGGATPHYAEAVVMATGSNGAARPVNQPVPTITTGGATNAGRPGNARPHFAQPIILHKANSEGGRPGRPVSEPVNTVTTNNAGALVRPIITPYYGGGNGKTGQSADEPLPAQGTKDRFAVATPTLIRAGHGDDRHTTDGRVLNGADPIPAITGSNEIGVATPFLVPNFGERPGQEPRTHDLVDPVPTIAASGHIQLARPIVAPITHSDGSNRARSVDDPLPTLTCAHRGEQALAEPALADGYYIDILYRMLHWSELARATSFEDQGYTYAFTGNSTEITKQIGNAVPIRTGTALCANALDWMRAAA